MATRLADRIRAERDRQFVGRVEELRVFSATLAAKTDPAVVLHVHGPGGVGKTTLLRQFESICSSQGVPYHTLDARLLQPTPTSLQNAFFTAVSSSTMEEAALKIGGSPRHVLFLDTYEAIEPLDGWVRDHFIPQLPENTLVVILGRKRPSSGWRSGGWQTLARSMALRNLGDTDVRKYLSGQSVPLEDHEAIVRFTHGFPLALCLVADTFAQHGRIDFVRESTMDVLALLLERFLEGVNRAEHRDLLELCVLVRATTESLIAEVFGADSAGEMFAWLRSLSFIEETVHGLMPHDLARDTIAAEVRWRNPDRYSELHHRARAYYADRLDRATGSLQQAILFDYIYLHRESPMMQPFFDWNSSPRAFIDVARAEDESAIVELVSQKEGAESGEIARYWFHKQPGSFLVIRGSQGEEGIAGLLGKVRLDLLDTEEAHDPGVAAALTALQGSPLRAGEVGIHFRFWMAAEGYQAVGAIQSLIFIAIVQHNFVISSLGVTMITFSDPTFWAPMFDYALHRRLAEADFEVAGHAYGIFTMDWRSISPKKWLELLSEQEAPIREKAEGPRRVSEVLVLSKEGFSRSVQEALRSFSNVSRLAENPLLESRLIAEKVKGDADLKSKVETLRGVIAEAAKSLNGSPKDAKLFHALDAGYLRPKRSQEHAAEVLDISIATFRRHLKSGTERLVGMLWQQETGT
jgi:hypothetical protein